MSASKMIKLFKILREESENIFKLKGLCPDSKIPIGILIQGSQAIKNELEAKLAFEKMKSLDQVNEGYPEDIKKDNTTTITNEAKST